LYILTYYGQLEVSQGHWRLTNLCDYDNKENLRNVKEIPSKVQRLSERICLITVLACT